MDSVDLSVLKACAQWIATGHRCTLVTVVKTWGSSPRPVGATLAICDDGRVVGSVSGGCIEDDLVARAREEGVLGDAPEIVSYGISAEQARNFGLPCGGTIELAIEPLGIHSKIPELLAMLGEQRMVERRVELSTGAVSLAPASAGPVLELLDDLLVTQHGPRWRLLIVGAGELSRFLAQVATGMDYEVTVCDPRDEYYRDFVLPGVRLVSGMPDDVIKEMRLDIRCAVVALTHDPKLDDMALMEALKSDAFYVGAIGSRLNNARRRERLLELELSPAEISSLHGPIGLYIGSKTPSEIAISILAELTAVKNGVPANLRIDHATAIAQGDHGNLR